jgi:hypothetical protein
MKNFCRLLVIVVMLSACHRRTPLTALPAPPPASPPPFEAPTVEELPPRPAVPPSDAPATPVPAPDPLAPANAAFNSGNYSEAARRYDRYLQSPNNTERRDEALFRLALSLALPATPTANSPVDWPRVTTLLRDLLDHYPDSPYRAPATVILSLEADTQKRDQRIKQLSTELDKLKQIDAERRRRP